MSDDSKKIYLKLKEIRKKKGLTLSDVADKSGMNIQKVGRMERGETQISVDNLNKIAKVLNVPVSSIFKVLDDQDMRSDNEGMKDIEMIPEIYDYLEKLFDKHSIEYDNKTIVYISTEIYNIIGNMKKSIPNDKDSVRVFFQGMSNILERLL